MSCFKRYLSVVVLLMACFINMACEQKPGETTDGAVGVAENTASAPAASGGAMLPSGSNNDATGSTSSSDGENAASDSAVDSTSQDDSDTSKENQDSKEPNALVAFSNANVSITSGDNFALSVVAQLLVPSEGGGISLRYDPARLEVVRVSVDTATWDFVVKSGSINNTEGVVSDIVFSSYKGVSGNALLATIEFKSLNKGESTLTIEQSQLNPFASNGEIMNVSYGTANVVAN